MDFAQLNEALKAALLLERLLRMLSQAGALQPPLLLLLHCLKFPLLSLMPLLFRCVHVSQQVLE